MPFGKRENIVADVTPTKPQLSIARPSLGPAAITTKALPIHSQLRYGKLDNGVPPLTPTPNLSPTCAHPGTSAGKRQRPFVAGPTTFGWGTPREVNRTLVANGGTPKGHPLA